jgi:hypothetical protein
LSDRSAETLVRRGFCKTGLCKIWFLKNLDTKILESQGLAGEEPGWPDLTCPIIMGAFENAEKIRCHNPSVTPDLVFFYEDLVWT